MNNGKLHIQHELNRIQLRHGYLPAEELRALSARAEARGESLPLHRLHEVASFFPHYRLSRPDGLEVKVCRDMTCHLRGAKDCRARLQRLAEVVRGKPLIVGEVSCLGRCDRAPAITIDDHVYDGQSAVEYEALVQRAVESGTLPPHAHQPHERPAWQIDPYRAQSDKEPYQAVRQLVVQNVDLIEALKLAELRGMGGAGQLASEKWEGVRGARGDDKYVVCNADESEPGTFKDRELLLRTPHLIVEGMIVAGLTVGARQGYIYVRHEYHEQIETLEREIERARQLGVCGDDVLGTGRSMHVEVYISPGGYICGEQSALIEAMEDKRAEPRNKPPELLTNGLWDMPTLVNNVETLAWVPVIALRGGAWYRDKGVNGSRGMRFFSISGDLERPGVFEVPVGLTLGELIDRAGGIKDGKPLHAVATSGPSGGFFPREVPVPRSLRLPKTFPADRLAVGATHRDLRDLELDIDVFRAFDLMLGAGLVVYAEGTDITDQAVNCTQFFRNESCGKCVPCRQGSQRLAELGAEVMDRRAGARRLNEIAERVGSLQVSLRETSICGLGMVAAEPLATAFRFFRDDIDCHVSPDAEPAS
jgi:NADH:ubiquinone oxidoreductase subunit F (NADH-binding)/NADH:ubiquinone oxidoreductase subunit E